jgi:hypothetical protein
MCIGQLAAVFFVVAFIFYFDKYEILLSRRATVLTILASTLNGVALLLTTCHTWAYGRGPLTIPINAALCLPLTACITYMWTRWLYLMTISKHVIHQPTNLPLSLHFSRLDIINISTGCVCLCGLNYSQILVRIAVPFFENNPGM